MNAKMKYLFTIRTVGIRKIPKLLKDWFPESLKLLDLEHLYILNEDVQKLQVRDN